MRPPPHTPELLAARVRAVLEQCRLSREVEALRLLASRRAQGRAAVGIHAAWSATRRERPEMLAVEQGFFYPARLGDDPDLLDAVDDPNAPDLIDDVIDRLIELVIARGGWIATLDDIPCLTTPTSLSPCVHDEHRAAQAALLAAAPALA